MEYHQIDVLVNLPYDEEDTFVMSHTTIEHAMQIVRDTYPKWTSVVLTVTRTPEET